MVCSAIITNIGDFIVIIGICIFIGMIWMIQKAESCSSALFDALLIVIAGVLVIFFVFMVNKYF
jgi:hypothetical protein